MPTREEIKPQVIAVLREVTDLDELAGNESSDLERDLGLIQDQRERMAKHYSRISQGYPGGIAVSKSDAGACRTVGQLIDLVFARSKGETK
jgi:hypothetical protein